ACLADEMGLGKTVQAIAALVDRAPIGPALIVAPLSLLGNWARELTRFAPGLRARLLRDTARDEATVKALGPGDVLLVSYDLARIDEALLSVNEWSAVVLDEA